MAGAGRRSAPAGIGRSPGNTRAGRCCPALFEHETALDVILRGLRLNEPWRGAGSVRFRLSSRATRAWRVRPSEYFWSANQHVPDLVLCESDHRVLAPAVDLFFKKRGRSNRRGIENRDRAGAL